MTCGTTKTDDDELLAYLVPDNPRIRTTAARNITRGELMADANIRQECLRQAEDWTQPTGEEVREVLRLAALTGGKAAKVLGLGPKGDRTIRRWVGEDTPIPYTAWALLCDYAGLGLIWKDV